MLLLDQDSKIQDSFLLVAMVKQKPDAFGAGSDSQKLIGKRWIL